MTRIKLCGLSRISDIEAANELMPEYIGFVFWEKSKRYVSTEKARELKKILSPKIFSVGVFVNEEHQKIIALENIIDVIQLHGQEDEEYISRLKKLTHKKIIKAFKISSSENIFEAENSSADYVMLDAGKGEGKSFDWSLIKNFSRDYFLAGGLDAENIASAIEQLNPFAVDVSSGIETDGKKDRKKMLAFVEAVRRGKNFHDE